MAPLTKISVARSQLVTALDLFVRDKDPISVHCLACGGGEIIEGLAEAGQEEIFATHILQTHPHMDRKTIRHTKNLYWNAFKHFFDLKGAARDDEELFRSFDDTKNDAALFIGWWDYATVQRKLPVSAQIFQLWWYALNTDRLSPDADLESVLKRIGEVFPGISKQDRTEQKRRLRRTIEKYRNDKELLADPRTEA